jgi:arginine N-succinyltransferase
MLVVRPGGPADTDALLELAYLSGKGFTSLPENRDTLASRLALSEASFAGAVPASEAWYVLMLEDGETGRIEGVAAVKGAVGLQRPHFSFRVVTFTQFSSATATRFDHQALVLVNECSGHSEVGSLFLRPGKRQAGTGALLARSRYMLIAAARDRFAQTVMAELRGWFDERDVSPFWEGISAKFFRLPFEQADQMITTTDGQFIADLAPRHPIYLELVPDEAQAAIGKVHRHGEAARHMLESEGFARSGLIDIFDGGPTMFAPRDAIATVRGARLQTVRVIDGVPIDGLLADAATDCLLAVPDLATFRALRGAAVVGEDDVMLPPAVAAGLGVISGDRVMVC